MYRKFFGLSRDPFTVNPDPRFLFHTKDTEEALACLTYGVQKRQGFVLLTGEVGTGKTTLLNQMLEWLRNERMPTAFIFNPQLGPAEFLEFMMAAFGIKCEPGPKSRVLLRLNQWLLEQHKAGQTAVLVVDEAQNLSPQVLEEIRLLTNLETATEKLLQIVLCGQPELEEKLKQPQLRQRITLRSRTRPLTLEETQGYIAKRLRVAGGDHQPIFGSETIATVHKYARGIPRVINLLCEHALLSAYADQQKQIAAEVIEGVARDFELDVIEPGGRPLHRSSSRRGQQWNAKAVPGQAVEATAKATSGFAISRSMAKNPDDICQVRPGRAEDNGEKDLGLAAESAPPAASQESPAAPVGSIALARVSEPPRVQQPNSILPEQQALRPSPGVLIPPAKPAIPGTLIRGNKPRGLNSASVVWVLLALFSIGALVATLYFSRLRYQGREAKHNAAVNTPLSEPQVNTPRQTPEPPTMPETGSPPPPTPSSSPIAPSAPMPRFGRLVVSANAAGASISIDGKSDSSWVTPHTFPALPSGTHAVLISKEGYNDAYMRVRVRAGSVNSVQAQLAPAFGYIHIVTNPPGLEVSIDGRAPVPSPVQAVVGLGEHTYTIKRPGFEDYHSKFTVKNGSIITRKVDFGGSS